MGANDIRAEVFGLFAALIAQFDSFMRLARRTRQGLVPDFQVRDQHRHLYLADVKTIMAEKGPALMGTGTGSGEGRAREAAEMALSSPLRAEVRADKCIYTSPLRADISPFCRNYQC